ncbi:docking protein 1 isoform X2 [Seriola aureovittata]|uniref:docking protein 1 isoform X2 n=1 Tax=Seriola aureovittata TaxID=2871759 RepID=UPI0024BDE74A|nr:docking protein 1 isoform X2 [Seriola aureovittata]
MDSYIKTGEVYLQPHKSGKKWKPVWLSLFPPSSSAVGRLEIQGVGGGGAGGDHGTGVRRHHQPLGDRKMKVVRLSELISVLRLPPNAEACPMDNMSAFCVETQDRTMVFAALKDDCVDWVEKLCHSTFQRGGVSGSQQLHMEENQIYASADQASEFWVVVQRTDAAIRCGLQGSYWLQVGREALLLREGQKKSAVREWPYELLRRYGKDKLALTIEAGRRCDSGPGTFTFETQQAEKIFSLIQSTIKQKTSAAAGSQNQEGEKGNPAIIRSHSPLPKVPDVTSVRTEERKSPAPEGLSAQSQPAPITLMPLPLVPTHNTTPGGHHSGQSDVVYADPADCIQSVARLQPSTAQYVDPASVLPLEPPTSREPVSTAPPSSSPHPSFTSDHPDSVYSEVYDRLRPAQSKLAKSKDVEPIYTEPLSEREQVTRNTDSKPDPFAQLYAHVCKPAPSPGPSTPSCSTSLSVSGNTTTTTDHCQEDVIYENLGII